MKTKTTLLINTKICLWLFIVLLITSCSPETQDRPPNIESDGGSSNFFEGQKEEVITTEDYSKSDPSQPSWRIDTTCPGALPSKLQIGDIAEIIIWQLKAREAPGFASSTKHILAEGREVEIVNGPTCEDSGWWWYVHYSGTISSGDYLDFYAWMVEADYDTYYLRK